mmetsp:Transcript_5591/g.9776  ORF Transcript_5591/g.9776 Transcript_5591/m.9776 type:complete len:440 (-) Transcript_5591:876-2195(-)
MLLGLKALKDTELTHITNGAVNHVQTHGVATLVMGNAELAHKVGRVVTTVISNSGRKGAKSLGEGLHCKSLLTGDGGCNLIYCLSHEHLSASSTKSDTGLLNCLGEHSKGIVQRTLCLVQDVGGRTTQYDSAGLTTLHTRKLEEALLSNHGLLNQFSRSKHDVLRLVKGRGQLSASYSGQTLNTIEVSVLNAHHTGLGKQRRRPVVHKLTVNEYITSRLEDLLHLSLHFLLFRLLNLSHGIHRVNLDARAVDLDLVSIHRGVRNHNLGLLDTLGLTNADLEVREEALVEEGLFKASTEHLDNLDQVQVSAAAKAKHGINSEVGEAVLILVEQFARKSCTGNVEKVGTECFLVIGVIDGAVHKGLASSGHGKTPTVTNGHRVNTLVDELLGLTEKLAGKNNDRGGAITNLVILGAAHIDKNLGSRVVNVNRAKNSCTCVM